jgi:hypothetical protein
MYIDFKIGRSKLEQFSIMEMTMEEFDELYCIVFSIYYNCHDNNTNLNIRKVFNQAKNEIKLYEPVIKEINSSMGD